MLRIVRSGLFSSRNLMRAPITSRYMSDEGAIKKEGGKLAKKAAADENQYIRQLEQEQWKALQQHHHEEIEEHMADIKRHQEKIKEHEARLQKLKETPSK